MSTKHPSTTYAKHPSPSHQSSSLGVVTFTPLNSVHESRRPDRSRSIWNERIIILFAFCGVAVAIACVVLLIVASSQNAEAPTATVSVRHDLDHSYHTTSSVHSTVETISQTFWAYPPSPTSPPKSPHAPQVLNFQGSNLQEALDQVLPLTVLTVIARFEQDVEQFDAVEYRSRVASSLGILRSQVQIQVTSGSVVVTMNIEPSTNTTELEREISERVVGTSNYTIKTTRPLSGKELAEQRYVYEHDFIDHNQKSRVEEIVRFFERTPSTPPPLSPTTPPPSCPSPSPWSPPVLASSSGQSYPAQDFIDAQRAVQLNTLIQFYDSTQGTSWTNSNEWKSTLSVCIWHGVSCNAQGWVTRIALPDNNLRGVLTSSLSALTSLIHLDLHKNSLIGQIPSSLPRSIQHLNLAWNEFSGSLPTQLSELTQLKFVHLYWNHLNGSVLPEMFNHSSLTDCILNYHVRDWAFNEFECVLESLPTPCRVVTLCSSSDHLPGTISNHYEMLQSIAENRDTTTARTSPPSLPPLLPSPTAPTAPTAPTSPSTPPSLPSPTWPTSPMKPPSPPLPSPPTSFSTLEVAPSTNQTSSSQSGTESSPINIENPVDAAITGGGAQASVNIALVCVLVGLALVLLVGCFFYRRRRKKIKFAKEELLQSRTRGATRNNRNERIVVDRITEDDDAESRANTVSTPREERDEGLRQMLTPRSQKAFDAQSRPTVTPSLTASVLSKCAWLSSRHGHGVGIMNSPHSNHSSNDATAASSGLSSAPSQAETLGLLPVSTMRPPSRDEQQFDELSEAQITGRSAFSDWVEEESLDLNEDERDTFQQRMIQQSQTKGAANVGDVEYLGDYDANYVKPGRQSNDSAGNDDLGIDHGVRLSRSVEKSGSISEEARLSPTLSVEASMEPIREEDEDDEDLSRRSASSRRESPRNILSERPSDLERATFHI